MPGLMTAERNVDATATASHGHRKWWRKVWSLNIPPKIRVFWWRACRNFLPSKMESCRRHVERESFCPWYGNNTILKSLFNIANECPVAF